MTIPSDCFQDGEATSVCTAWKQEASSVYQKELSIHPQVAEHERWKTYPQSMLAHNQSTNQSNNLSLLSLINEMKILTGQMAAFFQKQVSIRTYIPEKIPERIVINGFSLKQILFILLRVSVFQTDEGYIELGVISQPNNILEFFIKDTGYGFTAEQQNQIQETAWIDEDLSGGNFPIYKQFYQAKKLINQLQGKLGILSKECFGSLVYFTVPHQ